MDLEKDESKAARGIRLLSKLANCMETLLQNVLFFMVMGTLCVLMIFTLIVAMEDVARLREMQHTDLKMQPKTSDNLENIPACRCQWPAVWCRIFYKCDPNRMHVKRPIHSREQPSKKLDIPEKQFQPETPDSLRRSNQEAYENQEQMELENSINMRT
uniref:Dbuz\CG1288-PA n=1 Tax=Drosophila buzzatii TaxID=7264 RepID=Q4VIV3_DROBU|nr:Dbuz\CG1288-PA [Drosophila buzzatii]